MPAFDAVYAEIELFTHSDLPQQLGQALASRFPGGIFASAALRETVLRDDLRVPDSVIYSRISHDLVCLVFSRAGEASRSISSAGRRRAAWQM